MRLLMARIDRTSIILSLVCMLSACHHQDVSSAISATPTTNHNCASAGVPAFRIEPDDNPSVTFCLSSFFQTNGAPISTLHFFPDTQCPFEPATSLQVLDADGRLLVTADRVGQTGEGTPCRHETEVDYGFDPKQSAKLKSLHESIVIAVGPYQIRINAESL